MEFTKTAAFDAPHARGKPTKRGEWVNAKDGDNGAAVYWVAISACWRPWPDAATVYPTQAEAKKANLPEGRRDVRIVPLEDARRDAERENAEEPSKDATGIENEAEIAAESTDSDGDSPPETDVDEPAADEDAESEQSVDPVGSTQDTSTGTDSEDTQATGVGGHANGDAAPPGGLTPDTPGRTAAVEAALAKAHTNHDGESEQSTEPGTEEVAQGSVGVNPDIGNSEIKPKRTSSTRPRKSKTPEIKGVHHFASFYPMMKDDELTNLAADISRNGQRRPIDVTPEGLILDGRNRNRACELARVAPIVKLYDGDPSTYADYVRSVNQHRNLKPSQLVMINAQILKAAGRRSPPMTDSAGNRVEGRWERGSVPVNPDIGINESKTWQNAMARAGTILDYAEEEADGVANGKSLNAAWLVAEEKRTGKKPKLKPKKEPTPASIRAVRWTDMLDDLKKTRTGPTVKIPEVDMAQIRAMKRECDRIIHNDLNGISS
jgi:hypothetical protein